MSKPRLLLIDENPEDRALAELVLSAQYPGAVVDHAGSGTEFLEALDQGFYDIVVTEFDTTWARGSFLLQAIRDSQSRAAIVVFTHTDDRAAAVEALKTGAADFVIKSSAGFLDLRRAVGEALPELAPESVPIERQISSSVQVHAEPFREAVESARQSISNVAHRPLGAVLGIIAILAVFIVLYATFFDDGSDAVEAGATGSVVASQAVEEPTIPSVEPVVPAEHEAPEGSGSAVSEIPVPTPSRVSADASPARSTSAPVVLDLRAEAEVWIQVTVDGVPVFDAVLAPGQTQHFEGRQMATLLIGNAAGLSVAWNGEDMGSLGREGQVRRLYFSPVEVGVGLPPS